MPNIFISGGTGYIGLNLLEYALAHYRDFRITVLTRNPYIFEEKAPAIANHARIKTYPSDVRTFEFPSTHFDYIIHGALDLNDMAQSGLEGTAHIEQFAREQDCRVLYLSSGAVYKKPPSAYGWIKLQSENILEQAMKARLFSFTGNWLPNDNRFAIGRFIRQAKGGGPITLYGGRKVYRSFMHTSEMARWCWEILVNGQPGRSYDVGSEEPISIHDLAYHIAGLFGVKVEEQEGPDPYNYYVPSTRLTREELKLTNNIDLCMAIRKTIEWQKVSML
jgi:dTDP-glucose 4,6-dehydratase